MITIVLCYYVNSLMLRKHILEWSSYLPSVKQHFRAIVVDDGSPRDPALGHIADPGFHVELYRIKQNLVWNVAGARNLGLHVAPDGWVLLTDIDHLLQAPDAERLVAHLPRFDRTRYYMPRRRWADGRPLEPHGNSYILQRDLYWKVGGCDEDFTGHWGAGEHAFRKMIRTLSTRVDIDDVYLTHYGRADIPDASTTEWGRRDSKYNWAKNPYLVSKMKRPPYRPDNPLRFDWEKQWPAH